MWHIVQNTKINFDDRFTSVADLPYTFSFLIKKRMQINSWMELPKEKRPPESIWDKPKELEEWFDRIYSDDNSQTDFSVNWDDKEVEK